MLYLNYAEANREVGDLAKAAELYHKALAHMNSHTQIGYLAEAHWGLSLVIFEQISRELKEHDQLNIEQKQLFEKAFNHANSAQLLYGISGEALNAASVSCDIALFEQATGNLEGARIRLKNILEIWTPMLYDTKGNTIEKRKRLREYNNVVSAASCYLAGVELETHQYEDALHTIKQAQETAQHSYILRRGEAAMMLGKILATRHIDDPNAEEAFHQAITILSTTDLLGAQIRAHDLLGRYLLKLGKVDSGEKELDEARKLSHIAMFSH